jgi:RNA polymerase sigma-70 factor, ECF subfamily
MSGQPSDEPTESGFPLSAAQREAERVEEEDTARLVEAFQKGDKEAFAGIYTRYFDRVYAYLRAVLKDIHEAEDMTQRVFLQIFEALPKYRKRSDFGAWLFTVVRNLGRDHVRKAARQIVTDPAELDRHRERAADNSEEAEEAALRALNWIKDPDLMTFAERMPLAQRQAIFLRFMFDLTNEEIAAMMKREVADVRTLQSRGLRFLEARMKAIGRAPKSAQRADPMRRHPKQAQVLRRRRNSLKP